MNVFGCKQSKIRGSKNVFCAFAKIEPTKKGYEHHGCHICGMDRYNVFPEHNMDGSIVYNNPNKYVPIKFGLVVAWENINNCGEFGNSFESGRRFASDEKIHPNYALIDVNIPFKSGELAPDTVCDIFGTKRFTLVSSGWKSTVVKGIPRVENCKRVLYGSIDETLGVVRPKCTKNFVGLVPGYINYTKMYTPKRTIPNFLDEMSDEDLLLYCEEYLGPTRLSQRIFDILKSIKKGEFINLKSALINNKVDEHLAKLFVSNLSTYSYKSIYPKTSSFNVSKYFEYYSSIESFKLPKEIETEWKCNIINYVMNFPELQKDLNDLNPRDRREYKNSCNKINKKLENHEITEETYLSLKEEIDNKFFRIKETNFKTSERFWYAYLLMKRALKEKLIANSLKLPDWFIDKTYFLKNNEKKFNHINHEEYVLNKTSIKDVKDDYLDSIILGLDSPEKLYPAMASIENVLNITDPNSEKYQTFGKILICGKRWSITEVITAWYYFDIAWEKKKPLIFWNWVDSVNTQRYDEELFSIERAFAINLHESREYEEVESFDIHIVHDRWSSKPKFVEQPMNKEESINPEEKYLMMCEVISSNRIKEIAKDEDDMYDLIDVVNEKEELISGINSDGMIELSPIGYGVHDILSGSYDKVIGDNTCYDGE